ncbi:MAG: hypothetical protein PWP48_1834 [Clostridiales bacterium]|nr:hypothetical protein [Clostridiales bacterium]
MKIKKGIKIGILVAIVIVILGTSYYFMAGDSTGLYEISENLEFSIYENGQDEYILEVANNSESDLSSCSIELYDKNMFQEGSKMIYKNDDFGLKNKSYAEFKINIDFTEDQYIRFQGHKGLPLKKNKITTQGALSALVTLSQNKEAN